MKAQAWTFSLLLLALIAIRCGQRSQDQEVHAHEGGESTQNDSNKELYDDVMDVHNEVMPKMDVMYKLRESLKDKIANSPGMPDNKKKEIEQTIVTLDSASEGMMVWMRQFNPPPDSTGKEAARDYLEKEFVKVKKVKADMLQAIERANALK